MGDKTNNSGNDSQDAQATKSQNDTDEKTNNPFVNPFLSSTNNAQHGPFKKPVGNLMKQEINIPNSLQSSPIITRSEPSPALEKSLQMNYLDLGPAVYNPSDVPTATSENTKPYINKELEKQIFTFGPFTPSKIEYSQVPRPLTSIKSSIHEIIYETGNVTGIVPTFGNHQIVDTGYASPIYLTTTLNEVPIFGDSLKNIKLPFGILVQPFAENVHESVPLIDFVSALSSCTKDDLIRCSMCGAYYNYGMLNKDRNDLVVCNFCEAVTNLTTNQISALETFKNVTDSFDFPSVLKGSIDYVAPMHYYKRLSDTSIASTVTESISDLIDKAKTMVSKLKNKNDPNLLYDSYSAYEPTEVELAEQLAEAATLQQKIPTVQDLKIIPAYVFVIDSTAPANTLGLKKCVIDAIKEALGNSGDNRIRLCVIAYDCIVYLYPVIKGRINMHLLTDVDAMFTPSSFADLFVECDDLDKAYAYLDTVLTAPSLVIGSQNCANTALGFAIRSLSDAGICGTVKLYCTGPPDVGNAVVTETTVKNSFEMNELQKVYYDGLVQMCYDSGISVDMYLCPVQERIPGDLSLQYVTQQTAGQCYYFPYFNSKTDYMKIYNNILRLFTVECGYNCELKIRSSKNVCINEILCPFNNARAVINASTFKIPKLGPDTALAFSLGLNDLIDDRNDLYVQCACMYNNSKSGLKLVRVHTIMIKTTTSINQIFKSANADAILNIYARKLSYKFIKTGTFDKQMILENVVEALCSYRHLCAPSTPNNQLILPDNLKLLPAAINFLFKYDITYEYGYEFLQKLLRVLLAPIKETAYVYTRTYCLHRSLYDSDDCVPSGGWKFACNIVPSSCSSIYSDGIYILDDCSKLLLYFGPHVKWQLLQELFGTDFRLSEKSLNNLCFVESETSCNLLSCIEQIRSIHSGSQYLPLKIVPFTAKNSRIIKTLLLEDEFSDEVTYINFLVKLHKLIKQACDNLI